VTAKVTFCTCAKSFPQRHQFLEVKAEQAGDLLEDLLGGNTAVIFNVTRMALDSVRKTV
jgi:hypothetical protein